MGIHAYEHYIHHTEDPHVKTTLQQIQQGHKRHAEKIAERIQNLDGKAVTDNGMKLSAMEYLMEINRSPDTTDEILKGVLTGQKKGVEAAEELVRGDLDPKSMQLVKENLAEDRSQLEQLNDLMQ